MAAAAKRPAPTSRAAGSRPSRPHTLPGRRSATQGRQRVAGVRRNKDWSAERGRCSFAFLDSSAHRPDKCGFGSRCPASTHLERMWSGLVWPGLVWQESLLPVVVPGLMRRGVCFRRTGDRQRRADAVSACTCVFSTRHWAY